MKKKETESLPIVPVQYNYPVYLTDDKNPNFYYFDHYEKRAGFGEVLIWNLNKGTMRVRVIMDLDGNPIKLPPHKTLSSVEESDKALLENYTLTMK